MGKHQRLRACRLALHGVEERRVPVEVCICVTRVKHTTQLMEINMQTVLWPGGSRPPLAAALTATWGRHRRRQVGFECLAASRELLINGDCCEMSAAFQFSSKAGNAAQQALSIFDTTRVGPAGFGVLR